MTVFCDVAQFSLVHIDRRFTEDSHLHTRRRETSALMMSEVHQVGCEYVVSPIHLNGDLNF
jgi:hypothetical protein